MNAAEPPLPASTRFLIPEVLEHILLHTDQRTLLTSCLRVSKFFQALINTSPDLQRHLFFLPRIPLPSELSWRNANEQYIINPLLTSGFPGWFTSDCGVERTTISLFRSSAWRGKTNSWRRKRASWRRMEIAQPPVRKLTVKRKDELEEITGTTCEKGSIDFPVASNGRRGLLMRELYDYVAAEALKDGITTKSSYFSFVPFPGSLLVQFISVRVKKFTHLSLRRKFTSNAYKRLLDIPLEDDKSDTD